MTPRDAWLVAILAAIGVLVIAVGFLVACRPGPRRGGWWEK